MNIVVSLFAQNCWLKRVRAAANPARMPPPSVSLPHTRLTAIAIVTQRGAWSLATFLDMLCDLHVRYLGNNAGKTLFGLLSFYLILSGSQRCPGE